MVTGVYGTDGKAVSSAWDTGGYRWSQILHWAVWIESISAWRLHAFSKQGHEYFSLLKE